MKIPTLIFTLLLLGSSYGEDMQKYLSKTQELVKQGEHEEALKRFVWFHENALEHDEAMYGVRLSFALSYWKSLGKVYPPALKAMEGVRDDDEKRLGEGKGDSDLFHDLISLNETLGEPEKTITLFELIAKEDPERGEDYWTFVKDTVLEQKRYDLARKYIKDIEAEFGSVKEMYDRQVTLYEHPQIGGPRFRKYNENNFVEEVGKLITLALAFEDRETAVRVRDAGLAVIDDKRLKTLIPDEGDQPATK